MKFLWERINDTMRRAKVFGGWLVNYYGGGEDGETMTFIPDPHHEWTID